MNTLSLSRRVAVLAALCDGASIRATVRITGVSKASVTGILRSVGYACERFQAETLVNVPCKRLR